MNNFKLWWKRRLFIIRFNFDLSNGTLTKVNEEHRGIGKTTYLVKQCKKYKLGLIVGSQEQKKHIMSTLNFKHVYTMADVKRYPHIKGHEFLVDETVGLKFLNEYYLHTHPKVHVIGGIIYFPKH